MRLVIFLAISINIFLLVSHTRASENEDQDVNDGTNQRKISDPKNGGNNGGNGSICQCAGGANNLIHQLVILVVTVLAQLLNAVVTIVQCLLGVEGINSLVGNILTNALPGVVGILNNLVGIIGQTLTNLVG